MCPVWAQVKKIAPALELHLTILGLKDLFNYKVYGGPLKKWLRDCYIIVIPGALIVQ